MRMLAVLAVSLAATVGGAHASSILVLGVSASTPSIVRLGAAEPVKTAWASSIVAIGEPVSDVTDEKVAAIPEDTSRHGPRQNPMVIRGGVVGGASAPPAAPAKATTAEGKPAADGKAAPTATASNNKPLPEQQPAPQPQPAAEQPSQMPPAEKAM